MSRTTRRIAGVTVIIVLILNLTMYVFAEERNADDRPTASSYMERGIRAVYHNMNLFYEAYYDDEGKPEKQPAGHTAIEQEWKQDELVSRTYLGRNGQPMNRVDGYSKVVWEKDNSGAPVVRYYDTDGNEVQIEAECNEFLLGEVMEKFGKNVEIEPIDEENFRMKLRANPLGFKLWTMRNLDLVTVKKPESLVKNIKNVIKEAGKRYK